MFPMEVHDRPTPSSEGIWTRGVGVLAPKPPLRGGQTNTDELRSWRCRPARLLRRAWLQGNWRKPFQWRAPRGHDVVGAGRSTNEKGPAFAGPYAYAYATLKFTPHGANSGWPR